MIVLNKVFTDDGISQTFWQTIYDVIFMQNGIKVNNLKSFIEKMIRYDIFWWFFFICLSDNLHTFAKTIYIMRSSLTFFYLKMVISLFSQLSSNFRHLFLQCFKGNYF